MVGVTYSVVRMYFYYVILLHVTIFQYVEATELLLSFPTLVFLALYVGALFAANYISKSTTLSLLERFFWPILLYAFVIFLFIVAKNNDPIVVQFSNLPIKYWMYGIVPFLFYLYIMLKVQKRKDSFFTKNLLATILIISLWYGIFESFANYEVITNREAHIQMFIKFKDGKLFKTNRNLIYAGRTKNSWFFYNQTTKLVRAIKNDDISIVDFDTRLR